MIGAVEAGLVVVPGKWVEVVWIAIERFDTAETGG
jgi:hypothetical protein